MHATHAKSKQQGAFTRARPASLVQPSEALEAMRAQLALAEQRAAVAQQYRDVSEGYKVRCYACHHRPHQRTQSSAHQAASQRA